MEQDNKSTGLIKRAYWLIKLRWMAIIGICLATFFARNIMGVQVLDVPLYYVAASLVVENIISLLLLKRIIGAGLDYASIKKTINFQITADLIALTVLLHYSGGIENPIIIYFVFHMIIASILLSPLESYIQATFASFLITLLAILEYKGIIPHHCLTGFVICNMPQGLFYVLGHVFILVTTLYIVVYMTSSISVQLRNREEAYRQTNIQLQQKDRIKDEYVLRVTHDIKGHLAAIQSCLSVLANEIAGPLSGQQADLAVRAHNRTKKLTKFVRALLRLTEMRLSDKFAMSSFSLKRTASSAIESVKAKAESKSIILKSDIEPVTDKVFGSRLAIEETITNLLLNSIKYTPANGTIQVQTRNDDEMVLLEISDTGIGIPAGEIGKVFDEFFRASNARKVERDGTGLGLSIAKQTIERHGGRIWAESQEGNGTKIIFTLPKCPLNKITKSLT